MKAVQILDQRKNLVVKIKQVINLDLTAEIKKTRNLDRTVKKRKSQAVSRAVEMNLEERKKKSQEEMRVESHQEGATKIQMMRKQSLNNQHLNSHKNHQHLNNHKNHLALNHPNKLARPLTPRCLNLSNLILRCLNLSNLTLRCLNLSNLCLRCLNLRALRWNFNLDSLYHLKKMILKMKQIQTQYHLIFKHLVTNAKLMVYLGPEQNREILLKHGKIQKKRVN